MILLKQKNTLQKTLIKTNFCYFIIKLSILWKFKPTKSKFKKLLVNVFCFQGWISSHWTGPRQVRWSHCISGSFDHPMEFWTSQLVALLPSFPNRSQFFTSDRLKAQGCQAPQKIKSSNLDISSLKKGRILKNERKAK